MDEGFLGNIIAGLIDKNNNGDGFNGGGCMWVVFLFFIMAFWGGGFGGRNAQAAPLMDYATQQDVVNGFNFNDLNNGIRGVQQGICSLGYDNLAQNDSTKMAIMEQTNSLGRQIADAVYSQKDCCCTTNRNIDSVKAEAYKNTCEITNAIHREGEATRALITANQMQELRDRLADRDRELQTANFQLSQQAQSANIITTLQPMPRPAYVVASPYAPATTTTTTTTA